jgi:broad specificity phosphatase PhoE
VIVLVRHASTAATGVRFVGRGDPRLGREGHAEAAALGARLVAEVTRRAGGDRPRVRVVASPLRRARQTAAAIALALGPIADVDGPLLDERLRETDVGDAEGRTWDELVGEAPAVAAALLAGEPAIDWPGGEPHASLVDRVRAAWLDLVAWQAADPATHQVVVSHGGPLRVLLASATGRPEAHVPLPPPASWVIIDAAVPGSTPAPPGLTIGPWATTRGPSS